MGKHDEVWPLLERMCVANDNNYTRDPSKKNQLLHFLGISGFFVTVALVYTGALQGTGDTRSPFYISIVSQVVVPLGICFIIRQTSTLDPLDIWLAILAGHATRCILSVARFNQGKWRSIAVAISR